LTHILSQLKAGRQPKPGPQNGRQASAPLGGPTTLLDPELYRNQKPADAIAEPALTDAEPKRPGAAANQRERATPKPPLGKGRKPRSK
jgi:NADH-quinone oxidoreductase subunit E